MVCRRLNLNSQVFLLIIVGGLLFWAWWDNSSKRNKIYCQFTNPTKRDIYRWVKVTSRYVIFEGKKYDILQNCIKTVWWDKGIIGMLFPRDIPKLDFVWYDRFPIDPNTGVPAVVSPEVRAVMNKEEWAKAYYKGSAPNNRAGGKLGFLQQWLPAIIAIGAVILVAVYFNSKMTEMGHVMDAVIGKLNTVLPK